MTVIISEVFCSVRRVDMWALRYYLGVPPVTIRLKRIIQLQRRVAANGPLDNAAHHRAMVAIQRDGISTGKCLVFRTVANRIFSIVCKKIETVQTFDSETMVERYTLNPENRLALGYRSDPNSTAFTKATDLN